MTSAPKLQPTGKKRATFPDVLKIASLSVASVMLFAGCKSSYDVTVGGMGRSQKYTGVSKPVYDKKTGKYVFKDAMGHEFSVEADRVRIIEPHDETSASKFAAPVPKK